MFFRPNLTKEVYVMIKLWLIFICLVCLPLSCSNVSNEEEAEPPGGFADGSGSDDGDRDEESEGSSQTVGNKTSCKGDGYTLYLDDCPEGEGADGLSSDLSDSEGSEGFSEGGEGTSRPIDILFVLNTASTPLHWFKQRFNNFIPHLRGIDWRMIFTNATYKQCQWWCPFGPKKGEAMPIESKYKVLSQRYLDSSIRPYDLSPTSLLITTITTEPVARSFDNIGPSLFNDPSYIHRYPPYLHYQSKYPLRALQSSFSANQSLTREEATFVAIIVSNQDEAVHLKSPAEPTAKSILKEFQKVYGEEKRLYLLSVIVLPDDEQCRSIKYLNRYSSAGQKIAEVAKEIGGGNFSLCLRDYSIVAKTIARLSNK